MTGLYVRVSAENLRRQMTEQNVLEEDLAQRAQIPLATINYMRTGLIKISSYAELARLAAALKCDVADLLAD